MNNKLFIVCPFAGMENFIRERHGYSIYFMTVLGSVFRSGDFDFMQSICDFIKHKQIQDLYLVNDADCRFIKTILLRQNRIGINAEKEIEEIYIDNYSKVMQSDKLDDQKIMLAKLNLNRQMKLLANNQIFLSQLQNMKPKIHGLVAIKDRNQLITAFTLDFHKPDKISFVNF